MSGMDVPETDEVKPEKLEEVKEGGPLFHCELYDTEIIHKIAQAFLPGLASACVDNTTGGLFKSPASVALVMRREMVEYLTNRSETFVAESVILQDNPEASDHPYDIITDFVDDFASSKRNIFSKVSGWLLSERREDRIDDFVQDMEMNGFWILERRESVAQTLLKNVDVKNMYHRSMKFNSAEELAEHALSCSFRTMDCMNEGCDTRFSAAQLKNHESICPFKIIPCEQQCSANIMRREMDRHCITVCPMKIVNCTFYPVGCRSTFPQSEVEQHHLQSLHSHLLHILRIIHKDASDEDLKERLKQVDELAPPGKLAVARDVRSLTFAVKAVEANLGPLQVSIRNSVNETQAKLPNSEEPATVCPVKDESTESPTEDNNSATTKEVRNELATKKEEDKKPIIVKGECNGSPSMKGSCIELETNEEDYSSSTTEKEGRVKSQTNEECGDSSFLNNEFSDSAYNKEDRGAYLTEAPPQSSDLRP